MVKNNFIFDRRLLFHNSKRYQHQFANYNLIHHQIANKINEDLTFINKSYEQTLEINSKDDYLKSLLIKNKIVNNYLSTNANTVCDEELLPFKKSAFDLIISNLNLQFVNLIESFLIQAKEILKENGLIILTFFGENNLAELNQAIYHSENQIYQALSPRMIPTIDIKTAGQLLVKAGFINPIADIEEIEIEFCEVKDLLNYLKFANLGNILNKRSRKFFTKKLLDSLINYYQNNFKNDQGYYLATFKIITIIAQKK
ncbi:SAM-dependent methyltransferase [Alphaproteobacteria bacterium]|nr:SAM-dependent methyltransferase [Alphaproteobacteria bacterium]